MNYSIPDHWDPSGIINSTSNPQEEFDRWETFAGEHPEDWGGNEFTLEDFERYILSFLA